VFLATDPRDGDVKLFTRSLDDARPFALDGTDGAREPFFSPDGAWLAYFRRGQLEKIPIGGGRTLRLAALPGVAKGGVWTSQGILYSPEASSGLVRLNEDGSQTVVTTPDRARGEISHRWPDVLPDGEHVLFTVKRSDITTFDEADVAVLSLSTGETKTVVSGASYARYAPSGHILFARAGALYAAPFDADRLKVRGPTEQVLAGVMMEPASGAAQFAVAPNGTLLYAPGGPFEPSLELVWAYRDGREELVGAPRRHYTEGQAVSPDGRRIAVVIGGATDTLFVYDIGGGTLTRLTWEGNCMRPSWTPDGNAIVYASDRDGGGLYLSPVDGSRPPERLLAGGDALVLHSEVVPTPDGPAVLYVRDGDVWLLPLDGGGAPSCLGETPFIEQHPTVSPDGRWIAYLSDETGQSEVYVRPFPAGPGRWQISNHGGASATWSADGTELLYAEVDEPTHRFTRTVSISTSDGLSAGRPEWAFHQGGARDERRMLVAIDRTEPVQSPTVVAVLDLSGTLAPRPPPAWLPWGARP
jgi:serine/threonine-protein kinase